MSRWAFSLPLGDAMPDFSYLATRTVLPGVEPQLMQGRESDLVKHLERLELEFAGASELAFYHAVLNTLIRRDLQAARAFEHFDCAWREHADHLLKLSSRWLVAACDTLMAHAPNPAERAIACVGSTLLNVVKLYETERLIFETRAGESLRDLARTRPLFDGMTSFSIGHGDMVFNLRQRTEALCSVPTTATMIVQEIIRRVDAHDTIFRRLGELHLRPETQWLRSGQNGSPLQGAPESSPGK